MGTLQTHNKVGGKHRREQASKPAPKAPFSKLTHLQGRLETPRRSVPQTARKAVASLHRRAAMAVAATIAVLLDDLWSAFSFVII